MAYNNNISLVAANKLFSKKGIRFSVNEVEGGYVASLDEQQIRRQTLSLCLEVVLDEWLEIKTEKEK